MAILTIEEVEARFSSLRKQYSQQQWKDVDLLNKKVDELAQHDLPLAYRLMQRVKNLDPSAESRRQLSFLAKQVKQQHPELIASYSSGSYAGKVKIKAQLFVDMLNVKAKAGSFKSTSAHFFFFVGIPFIIYALYLTLWATERYESRSQLILKQPDAMTTLDPTMALMSGFTGIQSSNDNELLNAYIMSADMIKHVEQELAVSRHFSDKKYDMFSRLDDDFTREDIHSFFSNKVKVQIDAMSGVISLFVQGFEPDFANQLNQAIVDRAEWYINEIGQNLAKEQLLFVEQEHDLAEARLEDAKAALLSFQREYDLLDPEAEGIALQQITYGIEAQIATKTAQLRALMSSMSENAPAVLTVQSELDSLEEELATQRERLSSTSKETGKNQSVGEILAQFTDLKINLELALQAYTASQVSLEKSRVEAYRQLKYLVVVETPTLPERTSYPDIIYNLSLFLVIAVMLFLIVRIVIATIRELR